MKPDHRLRIAIQGTFRFSGSRLPQRVKTEDNEASGPAKPSALMTAGTVSPPCLVSIVYIQPLKLYTLVE